MPIANGGFEHLKPLEVETEARKNRQRLVHTLRSVASWRHSRMDEEGLDWYPVDFRSNYRAMTFAQVAAVWIEAIVKDDDPDLEFIGRLEVREAGTLQLSKRSMRIISGAAKVENWTEGGPSESVIRQMLRDIAESELAVGP